MSTPDEKAPQPAAAPKVSTAPAAAPEHRWWSSIPRHLGRARTSTVVLAVLFVGIFFLYLEVKPTTTAPASGTGSVQQPAAPTTTVPEPTEAPTTTEPVPTTTDPEDEGTSTTTPEPSTGSTAPSTVPTTVPDEATQEPEETTTPSEPAGTTTPTP